MTMHLSETFLQYYFFITFFVFIRKPFMRFVFKVYNSMRSIWLRRNFKADLSSMRESEEEIAIMSAEMTDLKHALTECNKRSNHYREKYKEALLNQK